MAQRGLLWVLRRLPGFELHLGAYLVVLTLASWPWASSTWLGTLPWLPTWVVLKKENVRRDRGTGMRNVEKQNISYWHTIDFLFLCDLKLLILLYGVILSRGTISHGEMSLPLCNLGTYCHWALHFKVMQILWNYEACLSPGASNPLSW